MWRCWAETRRWRTPPKRRCGSGNLRLAARVRSALLLRSIQTPKRARLFRQRFLPALQATPYSLLRALDHFEIHPEMRFADPCRGCSGISPLRIFGLAASTRWGRREVLCGSLPTPLDARKLDFPIGGSGRL